jgi:hypothetical protein
VACAECECKYSIGDHNIIQYFYMNQYNDNTFAQSILKIDIQVYNSHCLGMIRTTWHCSIVPVFSYK